jgi:aminoglycoside phosphotransferase (APT) family kinase protein
VSADLPGLDLAALSGFLGDEVLGTLEGPLRASLVTGGRSNLTYLLTDGVQRWVLRRPPLGHVLQTAHDMGREYRVLAALHPTDVPVPRPVVLAPPEILGAPFYVMEFADGEIYRTERQLNELSGARADALADGLVDTLARLHGVDVQAVGLADLGRPDGYLERQLRRWGKQLEASHTRDLPALDQLGAELARDVPVPQRASLVHGDYRLDNVVVDPASGAVRAILDWEMATLGDPLADLASTVVWWDGIVGLDSPVAAVPGEVAAFPGRERLVQRYAERSGLELSRLSWYEAFAFYKIAAIFEGIHYRHVQGLTVGEGFDRLGTSVPALAERGRAALAQGAVA